MDELHKLSKLPAWAWGVAVIGGLGLYLWSRRSSSSSSDSTGAAPTVPPVGSINTDTPTCQQYPIPQCALGTTLIWSFDSQGCPIPSCQDTSSGGGNIPPSVCNDTTGSCSGTQLGRSCTVGKNCPGTTLRQIFNAVHQDVNCAEAWNASAVRNRVCLDGTLWPGFVVYY